MNEEKKSTRRRGEVLEDAILLAAWEELTEIGYTNMTMESVAVRARTNKAVLYRRWNNKTELVIAALRKHLPKIKNDIPNTGDLRSDLYAYLHGLMKPLKLIGTQTIKGLLMEPIVWRIIISSMPQLIEKRSENKLMTGMMEILKNADLRGEIKLEKLTPRIISLPWAIIQYEVITKLEPISDEAIAEIVDDIFIPLLRVTK